MLYYNQQFKTWLHLWSHTVSVGQKVWSSLAGGCNLGSPNGVALQIAEAAILWRLGWAGGCASKKATFIGSCRRLSSSAHGLVFRALENAGNRKWQPAFLPRQKGKLLFQPSLWVTPHHFPSILLASQASLLFILGGVHTRAWILEAGSLGTPWGAGYHSYALFNIFYNKKYLEAN